MRMCALVLLGSSLFPASPAAPAADPETWRSLLAAGRDHYERQEYAEALRELANAQTEAARQNVSELDQTDIWDSLGAVYEETNNLPAAREMFDRALEARRRLPGVGLEVKIAISLTNESSLAWAMNQPKKAEEFAAASKAIWERLNDTARPEYAAALNNLSAAYRLQARLQEALPLMDLACKVYRRALPPSSPRLLRALENMAQGFKDLGDYKKAEELHAEVLSTATRMENVPPALLSIVLNGFGDLRIAQGRWKDAEPLLLKAIETEPRVSLHSVQLAGEYKNLSCLYRLTGRLEEAREQAETGLRILDGVHGQGDIQRGAILNNMGLIAEADRDFSGAEHLFHEAIETWRPTLGDLHPNITAAYSNLAGLYQEKRQYGKAQKVLDDVLSRDLTVLPHRHPSIARDLNNLGSLEFRRGHYVKAEAYLREAVSIFRSTLGPDHPDTGMSEGNLANALSAMKRADAQAFFDDSLRILERSWGADNPKLIGALEAYAQFLRGNSQSALAEQTETRAMHIRVVNAIAAEEAGKAKS